MVVLAVVKSCQARGSSCRRSVPNVALAKAIESEAGQSAVPCQHDEQVLPPPKH